DPGNVVLHCLGGTEQHLAVVAARVGRTLDLDRIEALLDRARALVGGEDALARRHHGLGDLFQCQRFRHGLVSIASIVLPGCPWHSANATASKGVSSLGRGRNGPSCLPRAFPAVTQRSQSLRHPRSPTGPLAHRENRGWPTPTEPSDPAFASARSGYRLADIP